METINFVIDWLKEYGDVLGGIGSIFAVTTLLLTNGKVIFQRIKGNEADDILPALSLPSDGLALQTSTSKSLISKIIKPNIKTITIGPIETIDFTDDVFASGLLEELHIELQKADFNIVSYSNARHSLNIKLRTSDENTRATAHICDMNGEYIFSERYTVLSGDILTAQTEIAVDVSKDAADCILSKGALEKEVAEEKGTTAPEKPQEISPKSRIVTTILTIVFGFLDVHRYYIGRPFTGILYTLTGGFFAVGWFLDIILALFGILADGKGRPISGKKKRLKMEAA
jgi:TM2 domain-containing membrane protein YozV/TolB-like protein